VASEPANETQERVAELMLESLSEPALGFLTSAEGAELHSLLLSWQAAFEWGDGPRWLTPERKARVKALAEKLRIFPFYYTGAMLAGRIQVLLGRPSEEELSRRAAEVFG
jgi:hypothetical protein